MSIVEPRTLAETITAAIFPQPAFDLACWPDKVASGAKPLVSIVVCLPEMDPYQRPKGLKLTAVLMSFTNAMGWFIVDWSRPYAVTTFCLFTFFIMVGYAVIWFYWQGHNWARILIL